MRPQSAARPRLTVTPNTRQYTLETSSSCAYGEGNINGENNDDFLDGTYTSRCGGFTPASLRGRVAAAQMGGTPLQGDLTFNGDGTWSLANAVSGTTYAIGVKDGGSPKWAVFLVTATADGTLTGTWSITKCTPQGCVLDGQHRSVHTSCCTTARAAAHGRRRHGRRRHGWRRNSGTGVFGPLRPWTAGRRLSFPPSDGLAAGLAFFPDRRHTASGVRKSAARNFFPDS